LIFTTEFLFAIRSSIGKLSFSDLFSVFLPVLGNALLCVMGLEFLFSGSYRKIDSACFWIGS